MTKIIETQNISKRYVMGEEVIDALKNINISVNKGEYVAFMGPSGSGKSTLMNIVGCLDTPSTGKYILNGQDVSEMSENELAAVRNKEIGFVFQTFNLLPRQSALENVALPLIYAGYSKARRTEIAMETLRGVGLDNRALHKPNELSGGQRQRIAIARAILYNAPILLLDEATSALDPISEELIKNAFNSLMKNKTSIVIAHRLSTIINADKIIVINNGEVVEQGNHQELIALNGFYANLYYKQFSTEN